MWTQRILTPPAQVKESDSYLQGRRYAELDALLPAVFDRAFSSLRSRRW